MFFSVLTKNSDRKILTKSLVTFKKLNEVKVEKLWGFTEISNF